MQVKGEVKKKITKNLTTVPKDTFLGLSPKLKSTLIAGGGPASKEMKTKQVR